MFLQEIIQQRKQGLLLDLVDGHSIHDWLNHAAVGGDDEDFVWLDPERDTLLFPDGLWERARKSLRIPGGPTPPPPPWAAPLLSHLQLLEDLEGEQLLPEVVPALDDDGEEAPGGQVAVGGPFPDPPAGNRQGWEREEREDGQRVSPEVSDQGLRARKASGIAQLGLRQKRLQGPGLQESAH